MKEIKYLFTILLGFLLGAIAYEVFIDKASHLNINTTTQSTLDVIDEPSTSPLDVEYNSISEILDARIMNEDVYFTDSVFRALPLPVLTNVAKVILDKHGTITIRKLVYEYLSHEDIYNILSTDSPQNNVTTDAKSLPSARDNPITKIDTTNLSITSTE